MKFYTIFKYYEDEKYLCKRNLTKQILKIFCTLNKYTYYINIQSNLLSYRFVIYFDEIIPRIFYDKIERN